MASRRPQWPANRPIDHKALVFRLFTTHHDSLLFPPNTLQSRFSRSSHLHPLALTLFHHIFSHHHHFSLSVTLTRCVYHPNLLLKGLRLTNSSTALQKLQNALHCHRRCRRGLHWPCQRPELLDFRSSLRRPKLCRPEHKIGMVSLSA